MHRTSTTALRRPTGRWVILTLLAALLLLSLVQAVPALGAANYTGGPVAVNNDGKADYPLYIANDHSVYAMRFTADAGTLLDAGGTAVTAAGAQYYVKVRISPTATPSGGASRGFTWNPTTQRWVQERADWSEFPTVTTGTGGAILASNTWTYFKFGDTTKPAPSSSSTWYIVISLQPIDGGAGTTQNNTSPPAVTLTDMTGALDPATFTSAFRIHNGLTSGATAGRRIEASASGLNMVWALSRTQSNGVDQGYGTTAAGDFQLAVPVGMAFDAHIQNAVWPVAASSFTGSLADVDIALGAADTTPPAAPATLSAAAGDGHVQLSWPAVSDAASYTVYRWQAATPVGGSTNYTPQHMAVATVATTSYDATGLANGEEYFFEVRANDAATNIGPPTATQAATPKAAAQLTLQTSATVVKWGGKAALTGELTDGAVPFAAGQQVRVERSYDGSTWTLLRMLDPTAPYAYGVVVQPTRRTKYRLVFTGDATHASATSRTVTVTPQVKLGKPMAPASVTKGRMFTTYGDLVPRAVAGSHTVKIRCYQKGSGGWKLKKTVTTTNRNYRTSSRYTAKFSLPSKGSWKLVAYAAATSKYAATSSNPEYLRVK